MTLSPCRNHGYAKNRDGYADTTIHGRHSTLHRVVYCIHHKISLGSINGKVVRHICDNPSCINPEHLVLGTPADNVRDTWERNRGNPAKGENHVQAKLTEEDVREIRRRTTDPQWLLAKEFGVKRAAISKIQLRTTWKHVT